ncbi:unnamed protein product [Linum tenue]|uniref:Uncharacterized protein n=2 Tax=Linum tenue TaxID=586396 RepID=A0AAV0Q325_9ROSI|nr:unnamed protein product [Linum tenue]
MAVSSNERKPFGDGIRWENPFTFKVGQVFTGFGIGCGVGIGHGRPIHLGTSPHFFFCFFQHWCCLYNWEVEMNVGSFFKLKNGEIHQKFHHQTPCALPMVNQVLSATRGATDAFSGFSRHVNDALRKVGAKNIEAGVGCGIGFGHGFGVGIAVKPGVLQRIQVCFLEAMTTVMMKLGGVPNMSAIQGGLPISLPGGISLASGPTSNSPATPITQLGGNFPDLSLQGLPGSGKVNRHSTYTTQASEMGLADSSFSRTEKVLSSFLQNPMLRENDPALKQAAGRLQSENSMLQMVLKHQQIIEELVEENKKLRQILLEDLKVPSSKIQDSYRVQSPCIECFDCRRKQRKRR